MRGSGEGLSSRRSRGGNVSHRRETGRETPTVFGSPKIVNREVPRTSRSLRAFGSRDWKIFFCLFYDSRVNCGHTSRSLNGSSEEVEVRGTRGWVEDSSFLPQVDVLRTGVLRDPRAVGVGVDEAGK